MTDVVGKDNKDNNDDACILYEKREARESVKFRITKDVSKYISSSIHNQKL